MSKELKKFNSLEEMNNWLQDGVTIYSLGNAGDTWFVEYESSFSKASSESKSNRSLDDYIKKFTRLGYVKDYGSGVYFVSPCHLQSILISISHEDESVINEIIGWLHSVTSHSVSSLWEDLGNYGRPSKK